ncbi:hypothetical protein RvY_18509 [Ramazzottius varieornatus]|uniref:Uncharacterized protein n=1 Tax=Ramazzottius varieornatus TaxID=947166 RepID=A0A1D1W7J4_RAMVA|nr:hypothetical protein RvY_18509 [Ramazzottius varieornatus]
MLRLSFNFLETSPAQEASSFSIRPNFVRRLGKNGGDGRTGFPHIHQTSNKAGRDVTVVTPPVICFQFKSTFCAAARISWQSNQNVVTYVSFFLRNFFAAIFAAISSPLGSSSSQPLSRCW